MKKHIIILLLLISFLVACFQNDRKSVGEVLKSQLDDTTWTFSITEGCIDSIKFLSPEKLSYYYCGIGFYYEGNYTHINDTIYTELLDYVSQVDASKGKSITCKLDFKYENNKLCLVKKWEEYSLFRHLYQTKCFDISQN